MPATRSKPDVSPTVGLADRKKLLTVTLRGVSRSFYLTLRVLPGNLREPVGLAYLLARAADTIADTKALPPEDRLARLLRFRHQLDGSATEGSQNEADPATAQDILTPAEGDLLASLPTALRLLEATPEADRARIRSVVLTLTRGMEMDLTSFSPEDSGRLAALKDPEELDRYTYLVAGCVGEFWTTIAMDHVPSLGRWDAGRMSELGVRFGEALQLTNVLRDVPRDLRNGRCYLPESELRREGVTPDELLDPRVGRMARPALLRGIETALGHYLAAEEYILATPRRCLRLRLATLWPVLIGLATLERLARNQDWLDPSSPSKVSRAWVYRMMVMSVPCALSDGLIRLWIGRLRRRVERSLRP